MKTTKRILTAFAVAATAFAVFTACNSGSDLKPSADGGIKNSTTDSFSSNTVEGGDDVIYMSELMQAYGDAIFLAPENYEAGEIGNGIVADQVYLVEDGEETIEFHGFINHDQYVNAKQNGGCDLQVQLNKDNALEGCPSSGGSCKDTGHGLMICIELDTQPHE